MHNFNDQLCLDITRQTCFIYFLKLASFYKRLGTPDVAGPGFVFVYFHRHDSVAFCQISTTIKNLLIPNLLDTF